MIEKKFELRTFKVLRPLPNENSHNMGLNLESILDEFKSYGLVQKVVIETGKLTEITVLIPPRYWSKRFREAFPNW